MATVLPGGWRLGQVQAQQPTTTYAEFKREILNEIARCLSMPYNVAACNSSGYNYASGRLDHQTYYKSIRVDQAQMGVVVLDRVLRAWFDEAILVSELLPRWMRTARTARTDPPVVLGRPGARRSGQGGQRPGHAAGEPHDHAGLRIRPAGPRLGERTAPAGQGGCADAPVGAGRAGGSTEPEQSEDTDTQETEEEDEDATAHA